MSAPKGNTFAKGNKGGGRPAFDANKILMLKGLCVDTAMAELQKRGKYSKFKQEIVLKVLGNTIPKEFKGDLDFGKETLEKLEKMTMAILSDKNA